MIAELKKGLKLCTDIVITDELVVGLPIDVKKKGSEKPTD